MVRNDFTVSYRHSEHGFASAEEVVTGTKARLRISAFRDSALARARRADSSTADWDAPLMTPIVAACTMRSSSDFFTNCLCALWINSSC